MSSHSEAAAEEIQRAFPGWRQFLREVRREAGSPFYVFEVPSPVGADSLRGLVVDTDNEEVTVSFDYNHAHFND